METRSVLLAAKLIVLLVLAAAILTSSKPDTVQAAGSYDAAADFSLASNPNGPWSYGYMDGGLNLYDKAYQVYGLDAWGPSHVSNGVAPLVVYNGTQNVVSGWGDKITMQPGQLFFHPGGVEPGVVRFTVPFTGVFQIDVTFSVADPAPGATTTDVHVLHNGTSLFDGYVSGNVSATDSEQFQGVVGLSMGDEIDFTVGTGGDGFSYDATFLDARISEKLLPPPAQQRRVVYVQGIHSQSICDEDNPPLGEDGFLDRAPSWLNEYLGIDAGIGSRVSLQPPAYFSYANNLCADNLTPDYGKADTCGREADMGIPAGIPGLALRLQNFINQQGSAKVTIVAHSMGGFIAAYLVAFDPTWAQEHIASVVTFDSPLQGVGHSHMKSSIANLFTGVLAGPCDIGDEVVVDMIEQSAVVTMASSAGGIIPFYTLNATQFDLFPIEFIPGDRTRINGSRLHLEIDDDHGSSWDCRFDESSGDCNSGGQDKGEFVACAVIAAYNCAFKTVNVTQGATSGLSMYIPADAGRAEFFTDFGSIVRMTLTAPDGTVYGPNGAGPVTGYSVDANSEVYEIANPAPGSWAVELLGVEIDPGGEYVGVALSVTEQVAGVGGVAELPVLASERAESAGTSASNTWLLNSLAGASIVAVVLLTGQAWHGRRRRVGR